MFERSPAWLRLLKEIAEKLEMMHRAPETSEPDPTPDEAAAWLRGFENGAVFGRGPE